MGIVFDLVIVAFKLKYGQPEYNLGGLMRPMPHEPNFRGDPPGLGVLSICFVCL